MRRLAPALAALALAACGADGPQTPATGGGSDELADLVVTVDPDGDGPEPAKELQVTCTAPTDSDACGAAAGVSAAELRPTGEEVACTQIFGGPEVATIKGRLRDLPLGEGRAAARARAVSFRVTVRRGPRVAHEAYETLEQALAAMERAARGGRAPVDALGRRYEPRDLVAARIELKGTTQRVGVDVRGDGTVVAWTGGVFRKALEGEDAFAALRQILSVEP